MINFKYKKKLLLSLHHIRYLSLYLQLLYLKFTGTFESDPVIFKPFLVTRFISEGLFAASHSDSQYSPPSRLQECFKSAEVVRFRMILSVHVSLTLKLFWYKKKNITVDTSINVKVRKYSTLSKKCIQGELMRITSCVFFVLKKKCVGHNPGTSPGEWDHESSF